MLDSLSTRLQSIFDRLGGRGRLTEENIQEALREVRVALLEADVNFKVVRAFIDRVREKAVGQDVLRSLTPAQHVVKVVHDELVELLGGSGHRLTPAPHPPTVIMLIGLQGSGKTTTAAKLARWYTKQGQHPLLAAADTQRPAAQEQLRTLGAQLDVPVVAAAGQTPLEICRQAREEAATRGGAALPGRSVTGRPIAVAGTGEKTDALEPFHPDRLASRILGMGDVLSLVERAQETVDQEKAEELVRKLREDAFTLDDFREQLHQVRQLGPLDQILGMLPFGKALKAAPKDLTAESADLGRFDAILSSMTPAERRSPEIINGSRRQRIARGSGTTVQDVNRLLKQFAQLRKMMKQFKGMEGKLRLPTLRGRRRGSFDSTQTHRDEQAADLSGGRRRVARDARRTDHRVPGTL